MRRTTARLVGRGRRGRDARTVDEALTALACARCGGSIAPGERLTVDT